MRERELPELVIGPYRIIPIAADDDPTFAPVRYIIFSPSGERLRYEYTLSQAREWALREWQDAHKREEDAKLVPAQGHQPPVRN